MKLARGRNGFGFYRAREASVEITLAVYAFDRGRETGSPVQSGLNAVSQPLAQKWALPSVAAPLPAQVILESNRISSWMLAVRRFPSCLVVFFMLGLNVNGDVTNMYRRKAIIRI